MQVTAETRPGRMRFGALRTLRRYVVPWICCLAMIVSPPLFIYSCFPAMFGQGMLVYGVRGRPCIVVRYGYEGIDTTLVGWWPVTQFGVVRQVDGFDLEIPVESYGPGWYRRGSSYIDCSYYFIGCRYYQVSVADVVPDFYVPLPLTGSSIETEEVPAPQPAPHRTVATFAATVGISYSILKLCLGLLTAISAFILSRGVYLKIRQMRRRSRGECVQCGYDLRESPDYGFPPSAIKD